MRAVTFLAIVLFSCIIQQASAVTLLQTDDFQDQTTFGWSDGGSSSVPPVVALDAGPNGQGDHALMITTTGNVAGPGSRLVALNRSQWTGDFLAVGGSFIGLDMNNRGDSDVTLRLSLENGDGRQFSSTESILLAPQSGWTHFDWELNGWTALDGQPADASTVFSDVAEFRVVSNPSPSFRGVAGAADVLIDNMVLNPLPEPAANSSLLAILVVLGIGHRRGRA